MNRQIQDATATTLGQDEQFGVKKPAWILGEGQQPRRRLSSNGFETCLLYTSDAADE